MGDHAVPAPGELGIKEKRSWKTWQLVCAMGVAALVGMAIDYYTVGTPASSSASGGASTLPAESGSAGASTTTTLGQGSGAGTSSTTTTTPASSTTTTASSAQTTTTTSAPVSSPAKLLLGPTQAQGNWTSPAFTTTQAGWNIGWAFQCTPAPTAGPSLQVSVTSTGSPPTGALAINETGASGSSVTSQTSIGQHTLLVQAPANCVWAVKVTGS